MYQRSAEAIGAQPASEDDDRKTRIIVLAFEHGVVLLSQLPSLRDRDRFTTAGARLNATLQNEGVTWRTIWLWLRHSIEAVAKA